ncbi:MAG: hypothetical protein BWX87_00658 [Bacteroidetes bacterium ADurb.Bin123]|jgi:hypothetical protein|nr:MAG: hypothetical protein BWX87_00658 [Bacteroidetes bacterium ADurb.Bin123]
MKKGYVSDEMYAGRISAHGKIASLANGFEIKPGKSNIPFSIIIIPKNSVEAGVISRPVEDEIEDNRLGLIVQCTLNQDNLAADLPVMLYEWTPAAIRKISANAINLTLYDVYWGTGQTITPAE